MRRARPRVTAGVFESRITVFGRCWTVIVRRACGSLLQHTRNISLSFLSRGPTATLELGQRVISSSSCRGWCGALHTLHKTLHRLYFVFNSHCWHSSEQGCRVRELSFKTAYQQPFFVIVMTNATRQRTAGVRGHAWVVPRCARSHFAPTFMRGTPLDSCGILSAIEIYTYESATLCKETPLINTTSKNGHHVL